MQQYEGYQQIDAPLYWAYEQIYRCHRPTTINTKELTFHTKSKPSCVWLVRIHSFRPGNNQSIGNVTSNGATDVTPNGIQFLKMRFFALGEI